MFLEKGARCDERDGWGYTVMHNFGWSGNDLEVLELLMQQDGVDLNAKDFVGETALHKLVFRAEVPLEILEGFLKHGALVNEEDDDSQRKRFAS